MQSLRTQLSETEFPVDCCVHQVRYNEEDDAKNISYLINVCPILLPFFLFIKQITGC